MMIYSEDQEETILFKIVKIQADNTMSLLVIYECEKIRGHPQC